MYSDFANKFMKAISSNTPIKKVRVTANSKPWFDSEVISGIQKETLLTSLQKVSLRNKST